MEKLIGQFEVIDYYFQKMENYFGRKHASLLQKQVNCGDSAYSGSPKSTMSDRVPGFEDEKEITEENNGGFETQTRLADKKSTEKKNKVGD